MNEDFYIDEDVVVSFSIGEIGWFLQRHQGWLRYLKFNVHKDKKFILFAHPSRHVFVDDFINFTIDLPDWFYKIGLDQDCYEAVFPDAAPGALTPPQVYSSLLKYFKTFYNPQKAVEAFTPRGVSMWMDHQPQIFARYKSTVPVETNGKKMITIFPRKRNRAPNRNVPEFVWRELVEKLSKDFVVCLAGTPSGAGLVDVVGENIINLIAYEGDDLSEKVIEHLSSSIFSISSQSGGTHISLLSGCNSYIIGHEKDRHAVLENRHNIPTSFRYVSDYRAIDVDTILGDISQFYNALKNADLDVPNVYKDSQKVNYNINRPSLRTLSENSDMIGVEIGVFRGENACNILENLSIHKLYLVDPYLVKNGKIAGVDADQNSVDELFDNVVGSISSSYDNVEFVRKSSQDCGDIIPSNLDFVYIDGSHDFEDVLKDLEIYYEKVKCGGLLAGHDYEGETKKAVDAFFKDKIEDVNSAVDPKDDRTHDWWIVKSNEARFINIEEDSINTLSKLIKEQLNE